MSSFSIPPLSGGINFDISQFSDGIANIQSAASVFPSMIAQGMDAPLQHLQEHAAQAAESMHASVSHGAAGMESGFLHAFAGMEAAMHLFPPLIVELIEDPVLGAIALITEAVKKAIDFIGESISEVSNKPLTIGLAATKAGVDIEYFSRLSEAARTVNISVDQLSTGFKFLQKNAVDAVSGSDEAQRSFRELGISNEWLSHHLNNTQEIFEHVKEKIDLLPSAAERGRRAMEVLGRSGADLVPLFQLSADKIRELGDVAQRLGVVETEESFRFAQQWKQMSVQLDEAWEGMKRRMLEPIMEVLAENWESKFLPVLLKLADAIGKAIPGALELLKNAFVAIEPIIGDWIGGIESLLRASASVASIFGGDGTSPTADALQSGREALHDFTVNLSDIHFNIDPKKAAEGVAEKVGPIIEKASGQHIREMQRAHQGEKFHAAVSRSIGGRR
jgi:hypothetical protein